MKTPPRILLRRVRGTRTGIAHAAGRAPGGVPIAPGYAPIPEDPSREGSPCRPRPMGGGGDPPPAGRTGDHPRPAAAPAPTAGGGAPVPGGPGTGVREGAGPSGEAGRPCPGDRGGTMPGGPGAHPRRSRRPSARGAPSRGARRAPSEAAGDRPSGEVAGRRHREGRPSAAEGPCPGARPSAGEGPFPEARPSEEDREDARPSAGEARLPSEAARPARRSDASCRGDRAASCRWVDRLRSPGRGGARAWAGGVRSCGVARQGNKARRRMARSGRTRARGIGDRARRDVVGRSRRPGRTAGPAGVASQVRRAPAPVGCGRR